MPALKHLLIATSLMLTMMSQAMAAAVTYDYVGLSFNSSNDPNGLLAGYDKLTASITFDQAHEYDYAFAANIISYSISGNGVDHFTQLNSTLDSSSLFYFMGKDMGEWAFIVHATVNTASLRLSTFNLGGNFLDSATILAPFSQNKTNDFGSWTMQTATTPVPEPETYGMLLLGLGMLGAVVRRRRQA